MLFLYLVNKERDITHFTRFVINPIPVLKFLRIGWHRVSSNSCLHCHYLITWFNGLQLFYWSLTDVQERSVTSSVTRSLTNSSGANGEQHKTVKYILIKYKCASPIVSVIYMNGYRRGRWQWYKFLSGNGTNVRRRYIKHKPCTHLLLCCYSYYSFLMYLSTFLFPFDINNAKWR